MGSANDECGFGDNQEDEAGMAIKDETKKQTLRTLIRVFASLYLLGSVEFRDLRIFTSCAAFLQIVYAYSVFLHVVLNRTLFSSGAFS